LFAEVRSRVCGWGK